MGARGGSGGPGHGGMSPYGGGVTAWGRVRQVGGAFGCLQPERGGVSADPFGRPGGREAKAPASSQFGARNRGVCTWSVEASWAWALGWGERGQRGGRARRNLSRGTFWAGARGRARAGLGAWLRSQVHRAAEPACAKAAGRLRSPGQCDGAGGGSRRAPGLGLGAGLGPGVVLSVRSGPAVEVSAGRAGG